MALRKIWEGKKGADMARVYRDADWNEYRLRFYPGGVLREEADYFTSDKEDAIESAIAEGYVATVTGARKNPAGRGTEYKGFLIEKTGRGSNDYRVRFGDRYYGRVRYGTLAEIKDDIDRVVDGIGLPPAQELGRNPAGRSGHDNGYNAAILDIGKKGWDFAKNKLNRELPPGKKPVGMTAETLDYWRGYGLAVVDNMVKANPAKRKAPMAKAPRKNPARAKRERFKPAPAAPARFVAAVDIVKRGMNKGKKKTIYVPAKDGLPVNKISEAEKYVHWQRAQGAADILLGMINEQSDIFYAVEAYAKETGRGSKK